MSKAEKAWRRFNEKPTPNDITFDEAIALAKRFGCEVKGGGNHLKVVHKPSGRIVPLGHYGKCVGESYVSQLKILFCSIEEDLL